ncbi:MAG: DUF2007 domain-containing protein [Flavobacteriaceae bacterium]|nr:DUF2007 domain-containing protein [Flavobacteriaceae bacterium]|tara:strand:- start:45689 stop:45928 length:240 start_codon:yes stop_codon:yes gene_type:complete
MNNDKKTTRIFTGSIIEAQPLINSLNELGINPIIRDDHQSGVLSGFVAGVPGQIRMYIRNEEKIIAKAILENFEHNYED